MKKVYSCKFFIYVSMFGIALLSAISIVCIFFVVKATVNNKTNEIIAFSIPTLVCVCFIPLAFTSLNRLGCRVIYNAKERTIQRKGFICGYEYQLKIEDIKEIVVVSFHQDSTYFNIGRFY